MGQRLVVSILDNGNRIAAIYYHWSAYFEPTIYELKYIKDDIVEAESKGDDVLLSIIRGIEKRGGRLIEYRSTQELAKRLYPNETFKDHGSSSDGLVALDYEDMKLLDNEAEGEASIFLEIKEIVNHVDLEMDHPKEYYCVDPFEMTFDTIDQLFEQIDRKYLEY